MQGGRSAAFANPDSIQRPIQRIQGIEKRLGRFFASNLLTYRKGDDSRPHAARAPEPAE